MRRLITKTWPWLTACAAMLPFLAWQPEAIANQHALDQIWNLGHIVLFACATVPALRWARARWQFSTTVIVAIPAGMAVGAAIEWLQAIIGRDASLLDVVRDVAGVLLVLAISAYRRHQRAWTVSLTAVTLPLLTLLVTPALRASIDTVEAYRQFPALFSGDSRLEIDRFDPSSRLSLQRRADGRYTLQVALTTAQYSGFSLVDFHRDWRGYRNLELDVGNPSAGPLVVTCKVQDRARNVHFNDRYNHLFALPSGRSRIIINLNDIRHAPATHRMNLAHIYKLSCFATALPAPRRLDVYRIALTGVRG